MLEPQTVVNRRYQRMIEWLMPLMVIPQRSLLWIDLPSVRNTDGTYFQGTVASLLLLLVHSRGGEVRMGSCDACHLLLV